MRGLFGASVADGRRGAFFISGGYTADAQTFADRVAMPLLVYSAEEGTLGAGNDHGAALLMEGM